MTVIAPTYPQPIQFPDAVLGGQFGSRTAISGISGSGGVEKYKTLNLDNLTVTGTIDASSINVTNINAANITVGTISVSRLSTSLAYIRNAAMISNAIITNAHITSLSADKITAGTINVTVSLSGGILQTSTSGSRVRMNGSNNSIEWLVGGGVTARLQSLGSPAGLAVDGLLYVENDLYVTGVIEVLGGIGQTLNMNNNTITNVGDVLPFGIRFRALDGNYSPNGSLWWRSDVSQLRFKTGNTVYRVNLTAV